MASAHHSAHVVKRTYSSKSRQKSSLLTQSPADRLVEEPFDEPASVGSSSPGPANSLKRKQPEDEEQPSPFPSLYGESMFSIAKKRRVGSLLLPSKSKENQPATNASGSAAGSSSPIFAVKAKPMKAATSSGLASAPAPRLTQLHLSFTSSIRTCSLCQLSYTRGAPDDERLHKAHCARMTRGMEWGKDEEKAGVVSVVETGVKTRDGRTGRIVSFKADVKGKLGSKVSYSCRWSRTDG